MPPRSGAVPDPEQARQRLLGRGPEPAVVDRRRPAARLQAAQGLVHAVPEPRLILRDADADIVVGDAEGGDLVVLPVRHLREQPDQLRAVLRDRLDIAVAQGRECEGRVVEGDHDRLREVAAQDDLVGGALVCTNSKPIELLRRRQGALLGQELLAGGEVRDAEIELPGPLVRDGEVRQNQIDLAGGQQRDTIRRVGGPDLQLDAERVGDGLRVVDVEAGDPFRRGIDEAERRVAVEGGDPENAGLSEVVQTVGRCGADRQEGRENEGEEAAHG